MIGGMVSVEVTRAGRLITDLRTRAGLTQAELARRARTSQPAVARYESGTATPAWSTLARILDALNHDLELSVIPRADEHDVRLAEQLIAMEPLERLRALRRYAALRARAEVVP
jgi:hypothetical protein